MLFSRLVEYFGRIEGTRPRNEKTQILANILKEADSEEVDKLVYLALGGLRPAFDRLEFQMADKMILRALGASEKEYQGVGDIGELAESTRSQKFRSSPKIAQRSELGVSEVYTQLEKIALMSGLGSQERKAMGLAKLIASVDAQGAKYIVRVVSGSLRLGFSDKTVIDALSYLENGTKEFSDKLDRAYQKRPDVGVLAQVVKEVGVVKAIEAIDVVMGTPIVPALAQRLKTPVEMIEKMGRVYCEPKYDGTRVQIHFSRKTQSQSSEHSLSQGSELGMQGAMFEEEKPKFWVRTFTRNLDESSAMFPELQKIAEQIKADEVILDSEAVGYDPKTGKMVPFQLTITRKRKHGVAETAGSVPLRFFLFDIMYRDGKSLIHLPLKERRKILEETVISGRTQGSAPTLIVDDFVETDDPDVLRDYHKKQLAAGLEGALVKQIDGEYMPGRTGFNWVKFKEAEDSRAKLADTIDCVIMGYYLGKGKRSDFALGAFLVGVKSGDKILTLAKVGTGITDQIFGELGERLESIKIPNPKLQTLNKSKILNSNNQTMIVPEILEPDVWVEPKVIVEVAADEITVSPTHSAGYALRFPRLVKFRDDKSAETITTLEEVKTML
ncbi:MAG: ATP-dependent DNA ligase [Microgenomates group bacterium]